MEIIKKTLGSIIAYPLALLAGILSIIGAYLFSACQWFIDNDLVW